MPDTPINVAYPATEELHLRVALGACRFRARPGEEEAWIIGTCHDPTGKRPPRIVEEGGTVRITEAESRPLPLFSKQFHKVVSRKLSPRA
jgi:hypothetical protein